MYQYSFSRLSLTSCCSAKYDLILEEQSEDSKSSHSHTSKKHKKKTRHCSEEKEDENYMPIKNTNQVLLMSRLGGEINILSLYKLHCSDGHALSLTCRMVSLGNEL